MADVANAEDIDFVEFVEYVVNHEKKLAVVFAKLDQNKDGKRLSNRSLMPPDLGLRYPFGVGICSFQH